MGRDDAERYVADYPDEVIRFELLLEYLEREGMGDLAVRHVDLSEPRSKHVSLLTILLEAYEDEIMEMYDERT